MPVTLKLSGKNAFIFKTTLFIFHPLTFYFYQISVRQLDHCPPWIGVGGSWESLTC